MAGNMHFCPRGKHSTLCRAKVVAARDLEAVEADDHAADEADDHGSGVASSAAKRTPFGERPMRY
eukprot:5066707-Prymnesium_polylepis.1